MEEGPVTLVGVETPSVVPVEEGPVRVVGVETLLIVPGEERCVWVVTFDDRLPVLVLVVEGEGAGVLDVGLAGLGQWLWSQQNTRIW